MKNRKSLSLLFSALILSMAAPAGASSSRQAASGPPLATVECTDIAGKPARIDFHPWPEAWVHRWENSRDGAVRERFLRASAPGEMELRFFEPTSDDEFLVPRADLTETSLHFSRADDGRLESWSCRILAGSLLDPRLEGESL